VFSRPALVVMLGIGIAVVAGNCLRMLRDLAQAGTD
jgi:hypothetical protein